MILKENSQFMLKFEKTKAKLVEFGTNINDYPAFPANSNELSFPTVFILSKYAESLIDNKVEKVEKFYAELDFVSQYFDAAFKSEERIKYSSDFLLTGASAYFLANDFGSAKVLISQIKSFEAFGEPAILIIMLLAYLLQNKSFSTEKIIDEFSIALLKAINEYFTNGIDEDNIVEILKEYRHNVYSTNMVNNIFYIDILYAITLKAIENSAWKLLPYYSMLHLESWKDYLATKKSIKVLWAAQRLIGDYGLLTGKNAIVQLPTGVGKTKSIEIIMRAAFLANRAKVVIVIAPLRALCNEITHDLINAYGNSVIINQLSDVLQDDFKFDIEINKKYVVVCTPEKLNYLMHHHREVLDSVNLYIFDEAHMFDDLGRGAIYELLVSEVKNIIDENTQVILLSAVLSNSEEISSWLFNGNGIIAQDSNIKTTLKSIGFVAVNKNLFYFNSVNMQEYDFYVPKSIDIVQLKLSGKQTKKRYFPEDDPKDVAIYFSLKLCKNGGVAIYVNRTDTVNTVISRVLDLHKRDYDVSNVLENSDGMEIRKLYNLIKMHYGSNYEFSQGALLGIFPHYSDLANGVRLAVEYAIKRNKIKFIVCTSTLAQGVNIPIKYLFMTSFLVNRKQMQIRTFQNLIGRTARSGIYTEGSIIVTDRRIYDNRKSYTAGGIYRWNDCTKMFDPTNSEACGSAILSLIKDFKVDYNYTFSGTEIIKYILSNYMEEKCFSNLATELSEEYLDEYPENINNDIYYNVMGKKSIIENIENYLCFSFDVQGIENYEQYSMVLCQNTLAYAMATELEKSLLIELFKTISNKIILNNGIENIKFYSKAMVGLDTANKIINWLDSKYLFLTIFDDDRLLNELVELLYLIVKEKQKINYSNQELFLTVKMWVSGYTYFDIFNELNKQDFDYKIKAIENICSKIISYQMSFLVGNIVDLIREKYDDDYLVEKLSFLQKRIKYGVSNQIEIIICESIFDDRIVAKSISEIIGDFNIGDDIKEYIKFYYEKIYKFLDELPSYFLNRIENIMESS